MGRAARVVHDGARPVRFPAGEWTDAILSEETIKRIKSEKHDFDTAEEPRLEVQQGEKAEDAMPQPLHIPGVADQQQQDTRLGADAEHSPHVASHAAGDENGNHASHKKRGPPHA